MTAIGHALRRFSNGGRSANGVAAGRRWAATVSAVAAVLAVLGGAVGCANAPMPSPRGTSHAASARSNLTAGLGLYESSEFTLAARRFETAAQQASAAGDRELEKQAVAAECLAWLRARNRSELSECTPHLEYLQRHSQHSDAGVNTLIAMGAIAGEHPLPSLHLPTAIQPLLQQAAQEAP